MVRGEAENENDTRATTDSYLLGLTPSLLYVTGKQSPNRGPAGVAIGIALEVLLVICKANVIVSICLRVFHGHR